MNIDKKRLTLTSKRLLILPLTAEEMRLRSTDTVALEAALGLAPSLDYDDSDPHLMAAYGEMAANCITPPAGATDSESATGGEDAAQSKKAARLCVPDADRYLFYTDWLIILKDENRIAGSLGFKGVPDSRHCVEIGYGIGEHDRKKGYAYEAVSTAIEWAFSQPGVYYVTAQTEPDNQPSLKLLGKLGFAHVGQGEEGQLFEKEKPRSMMALIFMLFGFSIGLSVGSIIGYGAVGMGIGMLMGLALGLALDEADKNARKRDK